MILAWLLLLTGLTISAVAIYYSVVGLAAIFSAAVIPIIVMGSALEVAKLVCASWLKANWSVAPRLMKVYMTTAVVVLMLITSMGIFGFLSKAHSDQSLVSGDVVAKISVYDEKIKVAKENIDANRKALKQMDEAVDQVMGRSQDEKGADKAVALRRGQAKERTRLLSEITAEQKVIAQLSEERAPIAAEVRKVEAEVGPLKYIAAFVYGETDETVLEKAVTWVIITIIVVFDPLAVIMLLAAQMTFGWKKEEQAEGDSPQGSSELQTPELPTVTQLETVDLDKVNHELAMAAESANDPTWPFPTYEEITTPDPYVADVGEKPTEEEKAEWRGIDHTRLSSDSDVEQDDLPAEPKRGLLLSDIIGDSQPGPAQPNSTNTLLSDVTPFPATDLDAWNKMIEEAERAVEEEKKFAAGEIEELAPETVEKIEDKLATVNVDELASRIEEEQEKIERDKQLLRKVKSGELVVEDTDSKKKSYMTKDEVGRIVTKNRP